MAVVAALTGVTLLVGGGIRADPVEEHLHEQVPQPAQPASRVAARRVVGPGSHGDEERRLVCRLLLGSHLEVDHSPSPR